MSSDILSRPFDIAPFALRCPGADTYALPTTFDYAFASASPIGSAST